MLHDAGDNVLEILPGGQLFDAAHSIRDIGRGRAAVKARRSVLVGEGPG